MNIELKKPIRQLLKAGIVAGSIAGILMAPSVNAATGTTNVDIDFPPLIILYYYDTMSITVDEANLLSATGALGGGCASSAPGVACAVTASGPFGASYNTGTTAFEGDAGITPPALTATVLNFDIANAWAVRSLGAPSLTATFLDGGGDFVDGSVTSDLVGAGGVTASLTLGAGNIGNIEFQVDLDDLTAPSLTATDSFTVTVGSP